MTRRRMFSYAIITTLVMLLCLEGLAQVLRSLWPHLFEVRKTVLVGEGRDGILLEPDHSLLWRMSPGTQWIEGAQVRVNRHHLRGPELTDAGLNGQAVAFLGDSSVFGWGVAEEESFPFTMGQRLQEEGRPVTIINGGTPGYSSAQARFQLEALLRTMRIQVVVIATLWSDLMLVPWTDDELFARFAAPETASVLEAHSLLSGSAVYSLLRAQWISRRPLPKGHHLPWDIAFRSPEDQGGPGLDSGGGLAIRPRVGPGLHAANLQAMALSARKVGTKVVFLILPLNSAAPHPPEFVLDLYRENFFDIGREYDAPVVDMMAQWKGYPVQAISARFLDVVHPSALGHHEITEALLPVLRPLLPPPTTTRQRPPQTPDGTEH